MAVKAGVNGGEAAARTRTSQSWSDLSRRRRVEEWEVAEAEETEEAAMGLGEGLGWCVESQSGVRASRACECQ